MDTVRYSTTFDHPVEVVFEAAADPHRQLQWDVRMRSVEKLSPGPLEQGAQYRARFKGMGTVEYDFEEYAPSRRFTHRSRLPVGVMRHAFTFEPIDGATRVTQEGNLEPTALGRLASPVMRRMLAKRFPQVAAEIAEYLDRSRSTPGP